MSGTAQKYSAVLVSVLLTGLLAACGSSNREGNTNLNSVARVDEATCRTCHAATLDPVSITPLMPEFLASVHNPDTNNPNAGVNPSTDPLKQTGCQGCHGGGAEHNGVGPIPFPDPLAPTPDGSIDRCVLCHANPPAPVAARDFANICAKCHTDNTLSITNGVTVGPITKQGLHAARSIDSLGIGDDCLHCHAIPAPQHGSLVGDNSVSAGVPPQALAGIRTVVQEFSKWSHHVTGVDLNNAHCAACHLEGTVDTDGTIIRDDNFHMVDAKVHLRNSATDADMQWDGANPNHTTMDNFCMSCHSATGATSPVSVKIQAFINNTPGVRAAGKTASALNPFGDTISNRYDKMQRPAVVNVDSQFNTTNNSHHAVKGKRYSGRTRLAGARQIATPAAFAQNSSALLKGTRSTIFDAGNFNNLYSPLGTDGTDATGLGDDSTLHCGDCHTVGQWKVGSSDTANGSPTPAAIGAHGSNNEYLLRNTLGTDQRHTQNAFILDASNVVTYTNPNGAFLVCYNCHSYTRYGSIYIGTGLNTVGTLAGVQPHAGEYDAQGRCNGVGNTIPFNGYTTGTATGGTQFLSRFMGTAPNGFFPANPPTPTVPTPLSFTSPAPYAGEQSADFGDIFGIQCANCHNSGIGNAFGGIHGSANNQNTINATVNPSVTGGAYIDGMGNTTKIERFLPGLGNAMHVPGTLGGFVGGSQVLSTTTPAYLYTTGGISNDTNWEQKFWQQTAATNFDLTGKTQPAGASAGAGCYTLGAGTTPATSALRGPALANPGLVTNPAPLLGTWGGCVDHNAAQGNADHGFVKRIVRPVTY